MKGSCTALRAIKRGTQKRETHLWYRWDKSYSPPHKTHATTTKYKNFTQVYLRVRSTWTICGAAYTKMLCGGNGGGEAAAMETLVPYSENTVQEKKHAHRENCWQRERANEYNKDAADESSCGEANGSDRKWCYIYGEKNKVSHAYFRPP